MASPCSSDAAAAVCCMCGDHGLPGELFQCSLCRRRLQHRYCSDLYPRAAAYRSCNWCLREAGGGRSRSSPEAPPKATATATGGLLPSDYSRDADHGDRDESARPCAVSVGCTRRSAFAAEPGRPVKKPKMGPERAVQQPVRTTRTAAAKGKPEVQPGGAGKKPPFRSKVRMQRYKLLAEVITSC